jgi:hypothetical protein
MSMKSTDPSQADVVLEETFPAARLAHAAVEVGIQRTVRFFEKDDKPVDPYLAPALVRYYAMQHIDEKKYKVEGLTRKPLANNGLCVRYKSYEIRVLKSDEGDVPVPGPSRKRQDFYQQRFPAWAEVAGEDEPDPLALLILWDVTRKYVLRGLTLVCPKDGDITRDSVEIYWEKPIPLSVPTPRPAEPRPTEAVADFPADEVEDLPLTPKRPRTGTDPTDD